MIAGVRAWLFLVLYSTRRQLSGRSKWLALTMLAIAAGVTAVVSHGRDMGLEEFMDDIVLGLYGSFVLPVTMLGFGTAPLAGDRDEGTFVYLRTRPLWRWSVYLGKFLAGLPAGLAFGLGGLWLLCRLGVEGVESAAMADLFERLLPAYLLGGIAYLALFHCLAAMFRHAALVSIGYVFFFEVFLGTVPGMIRRLSIRHYTSGLVHEAIEPLGFRPPENALLLPESGSASMVVLLALACVLLGLGGVVFSRREYASID